MAMLLSVAAVQGPTDSSALLRSHLARALGQHAGESLLPVTVTVDSSLRCFGHVCSAVPLPREIAVYIRDTARVQIGTLERVRVCRDTVPLTCSMPPSRTVLQVFQPIINRDSARVAHNWYDSGGNADAWSHGEEDVYARTPDGWRFVRVASAWHN